METAIIAAVVSFLIAYPLGMSRGYSRAMRVRHYAKRLKRAYRQALKDFMEIEPIHNRIFKPEE